MSLNSHKIKLANFLSFFLFFFFFLAEKMRVVLHFLTKNESISAYNRLKNLKSRRLMTLLVLKNWVVVWKKFIILGGKKGFTKVLKWWKNMLMPRFALVNYNR